jgi:hypothetical protein
MTRSVVAALDAARAASLAAIVQRHPASVEIDGQKPIAGATMGSEGYGFDQAGHPEINQMASVVIPKRELTGEPVRGDTLTIDGRGFLIESVGGHLHVDQHWLLRCRRAPGSDE